MIPFLSKIADKLVNFHSKEMEKYTIVLPSKRAIVFFKHYLSQKIDGPVWLPKIYSIEDFIFELSDLNSLDNLSLQFKLYEACSLNPLNEERESLDSFLQWSQTLLYDFNEIDRNLVEAKSIFKNLSSIKSMDSWSVDHSELSDFQLQYLEFFDHFYTWYTSFQELLLKDGFAYQGLAYKTAAKNIEQKGKSLENIWFVGLNALTTAENHVVNYFQSNNKSKLFFDADAHYVENKNHEAGYFIRQHIHKWGGIQLSRFFEEDKNIEVIGCAGNIAQSKVAGNILSSVEDENFNQTAVVLADENLLFPVLNNLSDNVSSLNITMGAPLKSAPLFNFLSIIFNAHLHKIKYNKDGFYYKDLIKLFGQKDFIHLIDLKNNEDLLNLLIEKNKVFFNDQDLKEIFDSFNSSIWSRFSFLFEDWSDSIQIINHCKTILEKLKEKVLTQKASVESEVLFVLYQCFQVLENHLHSSPYLKQTDLQTIYSIYSQLIARESIPFKGEPLDGLQLMGVLETRTLDFKNVIILSVNEDKLPMGKSSNSFLPFDLKRHFKMTTHEERDAVFSYHFYRLIQRSENAYLIYNTQSDALGSGEKSRFILQLENELKIPKVDSKILEVGGLSDTSISAKIDISKTDVVSNKINQWLSKGVSSTALKTYLDCSLQFYFQYVAGIRKDQTINEFIESDVFGTVIHDSLEHSFSSYLDKNLTEEVLSEIQTLALDYIKMDLGNRFGTRIHVGKNHLIWMVANKMVNEFFESEKKWLQKNTFNSYQVLELENKYTHQLYMDDLKINLLGKIDRVDRVEEQIRIVDYKSGSVKSNDVSFIMSELSENRKKSKAFQLMMYAYLFSKNSGSSNFISGNFSFKNIKSGFIPLKIGKSKNPLLIKDNELNEFEDQLKHILKDIIDTNQSFCQTDDLDVCTWCDFKTVCNRE
jgi:hypothetical protein